MRLDRSRDDKERHIGMENDWKNARSVNMRVVLLHLLLATPMILTILMTDDHPDGDHLEDHLEGHPDRTHQVEDHLKDHQGIQIRGYHTFPEEGHLSWEDLHKDCCCQGRHRLHCQHLQTIKEPITNSNLIRESESQTYLCGMGMAKRSWNGLISSTILPIAAMQYSPI